MIPSIGSSRERGGCSTIYIRIRIEGGVTARIEGGVTARIRLHG